MLMLAVSDQVMAQFQLSRWSNSYAATKVGKGSAKTRGYAPRHILKAPSAHSVNGSVFLLVSMQFLTQPIYTFTSTQFHSVSI